jgi:hypothetical protein
MSTLAAAAAWLANQVGEGGVFTKADLRVAFPDVTQIDRRVRDLRACGWIIHTRREDPTLGASEMRVVSIGGTARVRDAVSPDVRRATLLRSAYACVFCGAQGGTTYPDAMHVRVVLQVIRPAGWEKLLACCTRCRAVGDELSIDSGANSANVHAAAALSSLDWAAACRLRLLHRAVES